MKKPAFPIYSFCSAFDVAPWLRRRSGQNSLSFRPLLTRRTAIRYGLRGRGSRWEAKCPLTTGRPPPAAYTGLRRKRIFKKRRRRRNCRLGGGGLSRGRGQSSKQGEKGENRKQRFEVLYNWAISKTVLVEKCQIWNCLKIKLVSNIRVVGIENYCMPTTDFFSACWFLFPILQVDKLLAPRGARHVFRLWLPSLPLRPLPTPPQAVTELSPPQPEPRTAPYEGVHLRRPQDDRLTLIHVQVQLRQGGRPKCQEEHGRGGGGGGGHYCACACADALAAGVARHDLSLGGLGKGEEEISGRRKQLISRKKIRTEIFCVQRFFSPTFFWRRKNRETIGNSSFFPGFRFPYQADHIALISQTQKSRKWIFLLLLEIYHHAGCEKKTWRNRCLQVHYGSGGRGSNWRGTNSKPPIFCLENIFSNLHFPLFLRIYTTQVQSLEQKFPDNFPGKLTRLFSFWIAQTFLLRTLLSRLLWNHLPAFLNKPHTVVVWIGPLKFQKAFPPSSPPPRMWEKK